MKKKSCLTTFKNIKIIKTTIDLVNEFRTDYLNSLPEFQELYLEMFIENSEYFLIYLHINPVGYAIKTEDNILIEFYLSDKYVPMGNTIFQTTVKELAIDTIFCKSFDFLLLNYCLTNYYSYKIIGTLFRNYVDSEEFVIPNLSIRFAEDKDYSFLLEQEGELYDSPEELQKFIKGNNVIMFQRDNQLLGCGYLIKVHAHYNYYDIGMWVNPLHRRRGVATMIISHLKQVCFRNNWKPICGCAVENIASQKTLEKNGFISKHKLIDFKPTS